MKNKVIEISVDQEKASEKKCMILLCVFNFIAEVFFGRGFVISQLKEEDCEE